MRLWWTWLSRSTSVRRARRRTARNLPLLRSSLTESSSSSAGPFSSTASQGRLDSPNWYIFLHSGRGGLPVLFQDFQAEDSGLHRILDQLPHLVKGEVHSWVGGAGAAAIPWHHQVLLHSPSNKATEEWKAISFSLFCQSDRRFFRPFQQCRERWINHSNPSVKRGDWTLE